MTKSTITRERLQELSEGQSGFNLRTATHEESQELARMALAAMNGEPVAYIFKHPAGRLFWSLTDESNKGHDDVMPVYASPQPAPVVPEEKSIPNTLSMYAVDAVAAIAEVKGWNACRAAMLAAAPQLPGGYHTTAPGKWIPVSERMPEDRISVILWDAEIGEVTSGHYSHKTHTFYHCGDAIENEITHWMSPPCAPQEVKGE
ncbi:DUF551 domain-containing protein [Klebsiella pneumoniae]|uniref:DUF551 domain-containing protein n=1 Tax=Klebsiella pneumoniae TaxID=573 RepID=UPI000E2C7D91|nr:DUF551 domain-containing protein [Klebsiella pneumoniae]SWW28767.1 Eaa1 [Klebsiella pneumoniae]